MSPERGSSKERRGLKLKFSSKCPHTLAVRSRQFDAARAESVGIKSPVPLLRIMILVALRPSSKGCELMFLVQDR